MVPFIAFLGCNQASLIDRMAPQQEVSEAQNYISLLRQQKFDQIEANLDPSITDGRRNLEAMASLFPPGDPVSIKTVGFNVFRNTGYSKSSVTLEYQFPHQWLLADFTTVQREGVTRITGFHASQLADSLENLNRFTLARKSPLQYTVLLLAVLDLAFTLYVFVLCIRTKIAKRKWLWLVAILAGVGSYGVNWTNGAESFHFIFVRLPVVSAGSTPYGPWTIVLSFPLAALIFWLRRGSLSQPALPPPNSLPDEIGPAEPRHEPRPEDGLGTEPRA